MVGNGWWIMFNDQNNLVGGDWNMAFYLSISYMGCHPSYWLFFKMVETTNQNTFEYFFGMKMNIHVAVLCFDVQPLSETTLRWPVLCPYTQWVETIWMFEALSLASEFGPANHRFNIFFEGKLGTCIQEIHVVFYGEKS